MVSAVTSEILDLQVYTEREGDLYRGTVKSEEERWGEKKVGEVPLYGNMFYIVDGQFEIDFLATSHLSLSCMALVRCSESGTWSWR